MSSRRSALIKKADMAQKETQPVLVQPEKTRPNPLLDFFGLDTSEPEVQSFEEYQKKIKLEEGSIPDVIGGAIVGAIENVQSGAKKVGKGVKDVIYNIVTPRYEREREPKK